MKKKQIINKMTNAKLTQHYSKYFDGFVKIEAILENF